jgi:hypothetical protein
MTQSEHPEDHPMGKTFAEHSSSDRRFGLSRFIVPHESFEWYTRVIAGSTLAVGALLGVATWVYHQKLVGALGLDQLVGSSQVLEQYNRYSLLATGVMILAAVVYVTLISMFIYHKVAGPVYRLKLHMLAVIDGQDVPEMRLRSTDQLSDICDTYNQMLYTLEVIEPKPLEEAKTPPSPSS